MTRHAWSAAAGIVAAALSALAPLWLTYIAPQMTALTVGRLLICVLGLTVGAAVFVSRGIPLPSVPGRLALGALGAAGLVVAFSTLISGCTCDGAVYGLGEFVAVAILTAAAVLLAPRIAPLILAGIGVGAVSMAVLAMTGVGPLRVSLTPPLPIPFGRLAGPLGNPNSLAMYLSLAVPIFLVAGFRGRRWTRTTASIALILCIWALLETFSRSGQIAALTGMVVSVGTLLGLGPRHRRALIAFLFVLTAVGAAVASTFNERRADADFGARLNDARAIDRSGWDARSQGPIPSGPSQMRNARRDVLVVKADHAGEGVSHGLPAGRRGAQYRVQFTVAAYYQDLQIGYAIQDNVRVDSDPQLAFSQIAAPGARRFTLRWTAPADVRQPRFYVWSTGKAGTLWLSDVRVTNPGDLGAQPTSLALRGSMEAAFRARVAAAERGFVESRRAVFDESLRVFAEHPISGIGWQRFPAHARVALASNGAYATHNEYTRFMAELGVIGATVLAVLLVTLAIAVARVRSRPLRGALAGILASGAVGMLFANALAQPAVSVFLASAIGVVIGLARPRAPG